MYYTNEKPTTDGFYWVKQTGELTGRVFSHVVRVYNKVTTVFSDGENFDINDDIFLEWSNKPIEEPRLSMKMGTVTGQVSYFEK